MFRSASVGALLILATSAAGAQDVRQRATVKTTRPASSRASMRVPEADALLPFSQQIAIREQWLSKRHEMLLPMMRKHGIGMWVVVNEEFHDDPLSQYVAPPRPYTGNRDFFVFIDAGSEGLKKYAITGYTEENLARFFDAPFTEPRPPAATLRDLYAKFKPATVGLGIRGTRGQTRSLGYDSYRFLAETLGPDAEKTFVSAGELVQEYLDTRIPEEMEHYRTAVSVTEAIVKRALSNEIITPGKTTVGDVRRALFDMLWPPACARGSSQTCGCSGPVATWPPHGAFWPWRRRGRSLSAATWCTLTLVSATWALIPTGRRWRMSSSPAKRRSLPD